MPNSSSLQACNQVCDQDSVREFGFKLVCDQVRAGSSYLDMSRELEPAQTWSQTSLQLPADLSQIHYAILVTDRSKAGCRPVTDLLSCASSAIGQIPACCRSATSLGPVCDQDSIMEFGLNRL